MPLDVPGLGTIAVDVAYGGCFYVLVDCAALGVRLTREHARDVVERAEMVMAAARRQIRVQHPEIAEIDFLSYVMVTGDDDPAGGRLRGATVLSGRVDRSPCGTGTSARLACMAARGQAGVGSTFTATSLIDSEFIVTITGTTTVGDRAAVLPSISGRGWIFGTRTTAVDPTDPYPTGFVLSDLWGRERPGSLSGPGRDQRSGSNGARSVDASPSTMSSATARAVAGANVSPYIPWPPAITTFESVRGRPMSGRPSALTGRDPAHASPGGRPVEVEERPHRPQDGVDPPLVERRRVARELHGAAEPDAIGERRGDRVGLLHDDRVLEPRGGGQRDVVALTGHHLEAEPEQPADGADPRPAARTTSSASSGPPLVRTRRTRSPITSNPLIERCSSSVTPRDRSAAIRRVDVPAGIGGAVAGQHEPGPDVVGERRHHPPDAVAVEHLPGTPAPSGPMRCSSAWKRSARAASWNGTTISRPSETSTPSEPSSARRSSRSRLSAASAARPAWKRAALAARTKSMPQPQHRRNGARPDAQRAVAGDERPGGLAEHARPGERRHQGRREEPGVAAGRTRPELGAVDHRHGGPPLVQRERARQPDEAATDDDDRLRGHRGDGNKPPRSPAATWACCRKAPSAAADWGP